MFAFIALSLVVALCGSYFGTRNISAAGPRSLLVGMVLPVVAVGVLGNALAINPLSIAAVMVSAVAICVCAISMAMKAAPAPALARVRARNGNRRS